jgi:lysyl-tRNA synthetase class 2
LLFLFAAFIVTFLFTRLSVRMIRAGVSWWPGNVAPGGVHIHHAVFGAALMLIAGVGAFTPAGANTPWWQILGIMFGVGAALVLDEFALLLHLDDVYWSEKGRTSVDAVILAAAVTGLLLLGALPLGVNDLGPAESAARSEAVAVLVVNAILVLITVLKGKLAMGVLGLFIPFLAVIGAIRLAHPTSPWARWFYKDGSRRRERSDERERRRRARQIRFKFRILDAITGRPDPEAGAGAGTGAGAATTTVPPVTPAPSSPAEGDPGRPHQAGRPG